MPTQLPPLSPSPTLPLSVAPTATASNTTPRPQPPEVFQIVVECDGEQEQRTLFERLRREGLKLRLLVL